MLSWTLLCTNFRVLCRCTLDTRVDVCCIYRIKNLQGLYLTDSFQPKPIKTNVQSLRKKCPYSELFWSVFSRIRTEYGEILRKNTEQNNSECGHVLCGTSYLWILTSNQWSILCSTSNINYKTHCTKNEVFSLTISTVNMTKSAVFCGFGLIYWKNPEWKTSFFVQWTTTLMFTLLNTRSLRRHATNKVSDSQSTAQALSVHIKRERNQVIGFNLIKVFNNFAQ